MPILKQDANLPYVHLVWADEELTDFFNRQVLPAVLPGSQMVSLERTRVNWTPGEKCSAAYELQLDDAARTMPLRAVLTFAQDDRELADVYARHYLDSSRNSDEDRRPAVFLPSYHCLVEVFPHDWKLPALTCAASPREVLPFLAASLSNKTDPAQWHCDVSVLRHNPHNRCSLLYRIQSKGSNDWQEVIGKLYREAATSEKVFANHRLLHTTSADRELIIPRPLGLVDELSLVLMERVQGKSMASLLRQGADRARMARMAAAALAALHSTSYEADKVNSVMTEVARIRRYAGSLHLAAPELASGINVVLDRIGPLAGRFECSRTCLIHGSSKPSDLFVANGDLAFIDLDAIRRDDPAIDVGYFLAEFQGRAELLAEHGASKLFEHFFDEYEARTDTDPGLAERARVFCALRYVNRSVRAFLRKPLRYARAPQTSRPIIFLKEAAAWLDRL